MTLHLALGSRELVRSLRRFWRRQPGRLAAAQQRRRDQLALRLRAADESTTHRHHGLEALEQRVMLAADFAGNTLSTARPIDVLPQTAIYSDFVGRNDRNDYYRLHLASETALSVRLDGMTRDADLALLDGYGQVVESSRSSGTRAEVIEAALPAGTYYLRVYPFQLSGTHYQLSVVGQPSDIDAGGSVQVGELDGRRTYSDRVGGGDRDDQFAFRLDQPGEVTLDLTGLGADADLYLLAEGEQIAKSDRSGSTAEQIRLTLQPGDYHVVVESYDGRATRYDLTLNAVAATEPGESVDLGELNGLRRFEGGLPGNSEGDRFQFSLYDFSNFRADLRGLDADLDLLLLDEAGHIVRQSASGGIVSESIAIDLSAGTYTLWVIPGEGESSDYALDLRATPRGNSTADAIDLGMLPGLRLTARDFVGNPDSVDYYRIDVTRRTRLEVVLGGLQADADLYLRDIWGNVVARSERSGSASEFIRRRLVAGTYYLQVVPYADAFTGYDLTVTPRG